MSMSVILLLNSLTHYQTTNSRLFQTERVCRQQLKFDENGSKLSKRVENTVGKVTSNFSFSHSVFKRLVSQGPQKVSLCGNGLKSNKISDQTKFKAFADHKLKLLKMTQFFDMFNPLPNNKL